MFKGHGQRKLSNLVIDSAALRRFSQPFLILLVSSLAVIKLLTWQISRRILLYVESNGMTDHDHASVSLIIDQATTYGVLGMVFLGGLTYIVFMIYAHRILGPVVALRRQIAALEAGDYAARVKLRKNDELKSLAEDLNKLAQKLASK